MRALLAFVVAGLVAAPSALADDPCAGLAGCVTAPATPVVVIVDGGTDIDQASTTPGTIAFPTADGTAYWRVPRATAFSVACPAGTAPTAATAAVAAGGVDSLSWMPGFQWSYAVPNGLRAQLAPGVTAALRANPVALPADASALGLTSSVTDFSTTIAPASLTPIAAAWRGQVGAVFNRQTVGIAWSHGTNPTFSPSVACMPAAEAASRAARAGSRHVIAHHVDREAGPGTTRHWISCPAGFRRSGPVAHALFVEGRSTLTRRERAAVTAERGPGGGHVVVQAGRQAPAGLQVQVRATCTPR